MNIANDLIAKSSRYRTLTARAVKAWLVVVVPVESEGELEPDGHGRAMDSLRSSLEPFGSVLLVNEREIDSLPDRFIREFGSGLDS